MCEEVRQPSIQVPRAIVGGVALNALAGFAFLIPIAFVLPDVAKLAALPSAQPVPTIVKSATGNSAGAFCLLIPLIVLGLICGIGCVTATSRITWAFARDGAIPGSGWWKNVNGRLQIPLNSLLLGMGIELLLGLIYFGSSAAFSAFSGVGVIFLTMSYACPVAVSLILRRRKDLERGSYNLGLLGAFCNVVCIGRWMMFFQFLHFVFSLTILFPFSLVPSCYPTLLYADKYSRHKRHNELCLCCVCRFRGYFWSVVWSMG
jgi:amino acid transporter